MATVNFYLKSSKSEERLIYLFFSAEGKRIKYSTGEKIQPKYWNDKLQRAKNIRSFLQATSLNDFLDRMKAEAFSIYREMRENKEVFNPKVFKQRLKERFAVVKLEDKTTLFGFLKDFIASPSGRLNKATIGNYRQSLRSLEAYAEYKRESLDFEDIDLNFYDEYVDFLFNIQGYAGNTVGKRIKDLKASMRKAYDKSLHENTAFMKSAFKVIKNEVDSIYLTEAELEAIYSVDLPNRLDSVRDAFLIGCYTGLRYSDLSNLDSSNIQEIEKVEGGKATVIRVKTKKTAKEVVLPVHYMIKRILEKYEQKGAVLPRFLSNAKMNKYIKEVGELAGIDTVITIEEDKAGKKVKAQYKKFEKITVHTARRTFATNTYRAGVALSDIMIFTGHTTEKNLRKYLKLTGEENARKLLNHKFFNQPNMRIAK